MDLKQIKEMVKDAEIAYKIVSDYINKNFGDDVNKNFKKLEKFLTDIELTDDIDLIIKLIGENEIFKNNLNKILARYYSTIVDGNAEKIFGDSLLYSVIEIYCDINNIEIKDNLDIEECSELDNYQLYINDINKYPLLTLEEEQKLSKKIHEGDLEARTIFINSNLRLVVNIAKKYLGRGLEFMDLIGEGNIGLIKAVDRYDASGLNKFSTYAVWWIRNTISRGIKQYGRNRRIPISLLNKYERLVRVENELRNQLGREPNEEELAQKLNCSIEKIRELHEIKVDTVSINTTVGDEDTELGDLLPSNVSLEDDYIKNNLTQEILTLFENVGLPKRDIEIVMLRKGFIGSRPVTLKAIAKRYGITIERARQIESRTINKMRESTYIDGFAEYMPNPDEALRNIKIFRKEYLLAKCHGDYTYSLQRNGINRKGVYTKANEKPTKNKNIYHYFDESKDKVDMALAKLSEDEIKIIELFFAGELDSKNKFYSLVKKIKRLIENPLSEGKIKKLTLQHKDGK